MGAGPYGPYCGPQSSGTALYPSQGVGFAVAHLAPMSRVKALESDIAELRAALAAALPLMQDPGR